jgi:selenium metabolism protein YedF
MTEKQELKPIQGSVLFIGSDVIGRGENYELGSLLMQKFLHELGWHRFKPKTIVLMNNGVKLVTDDSPEVGELKQLENQGVDILACGTCLSRLELTTKVAVGKVSNMTDIANILLGAEKVISL